MKLTKRDVSVLLYIVAILSIFLTYQFYYSSTVKEAETVLTECVDLQQQVSELQAKVEQQPQYEDDIANMKETIADTLKLYPSAISEEDIILYVKELNDNLDMGINSLSFSAATPIYSVVGTGHASKYAFDTESISVNINYSTTYDGLKKIIDCINDDPEHRVISSISMDITQLDATAVAAQEGEHEETVDQDTISGSMSIILYLIDGKPEDTENAAEEEERFSIPSVEHGVDDIFRTEGTETTAASETAQ